MDARDQAHYVYRTPHGPITIGVTGEAVSAVALGDVKLAGPRKPTALSNECANQLLEYFAGKRSSFNIPLKLQGSAFQREVWQALQNIPYGQTRTMSEVAEAIGKPESFRMVGSAVKKNPLVVLVPAHRVVGANGKTPGTDAQAQRRAAFLELERRNARQAK